MLVACRRSGQLWARAGEGSGQTRRASRWQNSAQIGRRLLTYNACLHPDATASCARPRLGGRSIDLAAELCSGAAAGRSGPSAPRTPPSRASLIALRRAAGAIHPLAIRPSGRASRRFREPTRGRVISLRLSPRPSDAADGAALPSRWAGHRRLARPLLPLSGEDVHARQWCDHSAAHSSAAPAEPRLPLETHTGAGPTRAALRPAPSRRDAPACSRGRAGVPRAALPVLAGHPSASLVSRARPRMPAAPEDRPLRP